MSKHAQKPPENIRSQVRDRKKPNRATPIVVYSCETEKAELERIAHSQGRSLSSWGLLALRAYAAATSTLPPLPDRLGSEVDNA
jgi:hypothetical protein